MISHEEVVYSVLPALSRESMDLLITIIAHQGGTTEWLYGSNRETFMKLLSTNKERVALAPILRSSLVTINRDRSLIFEGSNTSCRFSSPWDNFNKLIYIVSTCNIARWFTCQSCSIGMSSTLVTELGSHWGATFKWSSSECIFVIIIFPAVTGTLLHIKLLAWWYS